MAMPLSFVSSAPQPIFIKRPPKRQKVEDKDKEHKQREDSVRDRVHVLELPPTGLDGLRPVCCHDSEEFDGPGVPWPIVYLAGSDFELQTQRVQRRFCSGSCAATWLSETRATTQADWGRLRDYLQRKFGFLAALFALPRHVLFRGIDIETFRSFGDYYLLAGQPINAKIKPEWLTSPTVDTLAQLHAVQDEATGLAVAARRTPLQQRCFHDNESFDDRGWSWPLRCASPLMAFCSLPCLLAWFFSNRHQARGLPLEEIRDAGRARSKAPSLELPAPAPDRVLLDRHSVQGLSLEQFRRVPGARLSRQIATLAELAQELAQDGEPGFLAVVLRGGAIELGCMRHYADQAEPEKTCVDFLDVVESHMNKGGDSFDIAQNRLGLVPDLRAPQSYRANGMKLVTYMRTAPSSPVLPAARRDPAGLRRQIAQIIE